MSESRKTVSSKPRILTGAQIVIEVLKEHGVDTVFGYPGGTILGIYDELYKQDSIKHILTSHEQGASHAADGYARSTGKTGVCFATSGPGSTNLVTGIATAYMDSAPVLAITVNVPRDALGTDAFQEVDITGITMPITKHNFIVRDIKNLAETLRKAFYITQSDRKGPVLVDITKDVTVTTCEFENEAIREPEKCATVLDFNDLDEALKAISEASRPIILAGGGVILSDATEELGEFAERIDAPVIETLMGLGAFPNNNRRYAGLPGMHGTKAANYGITESDLLIVIGARFSDRVVGNKKRFATGAKIIHIDVDEAEIDKNIISHISLVGDAKIVLTQLLAELPQKYHKDWLEHIEEYKRLYPLSYNEQGLSAPYIIDQLNKMNDSDAIIVTDVGQHQMWTAQFYHFMKPRTFLTSGGLGTMGFGLGAAIGAKSAYPKKKVILITGDGCFRMNMNELITAKKYGIAVKVIIINNGVLGMVRQWQTLFYDKRYSETVLTDSFDFNKYADSMDAKNYKIRTREELQKAFDECLESDEVVLLDCMVDKDDMVMPMVAAGDAIENVFDEQDLKVKKIN